MMKSGNIILVIVTLSSLVSCQNYTKEYYNNGRLKSSVIVNDSGKKEGKYEGFYETGILKEVSYYKDGIQVDSSLFYNEDKSLSAIRYYNQKKVTQKEFSNDTVSTGELYQGLKTGNWEYYVNDILVEIRDFVVIKTSNGLEVGLNQKKWFKSNGELDSIKSQYYHIDFPRPIIADKEYLLSIKFNIPNPRREFTLGKDRYDFLSLSKKFSSDFLIPEGSKIDTIVNIEKNNFIFPHRFTKVGKQNFRGIIQSHFFTVGKDSTEIEIGEILIDEEIFVKETNTVLEKGRI